MSRVVILRWWLTGPQYWSADLLDADGQYVRPGGYDAPTIGRIEKACTTVEEARMAAGPAIMQLANEHGANLVYHDATATTMTWDPEEG